MEEKELSRRETLGLAKFGLLLAAGLGVVESSTAGQGPNSRMLKYEAGSLSIKFFKAEANGFTLVKTISLPAVQAQAFLADKTTQVTLKFWRPTGGAASTVTDTLFKV